MVAVTMLTRPTKIHIRHRFCGLRPWLRPPANQSAPPKPRPTDDRPSRDSPRLRLCGELLSPFRPSVKACCAIGRTCAVRGGPCARSSLAGEVGCLVVPGCRGGGRQPHLHGPVAGVGFQGVRSGSRSPGGWSSSSDQGAQVLREQSAQSVGDAHLWRRWVPRRASGPQGRRKVLPFAAYQPGRRSVAVPVGARVASRGHGLHVHFAVGRFVRRSLIDEAWGLGFVHIKLLGDLSSGAGDLSESRMARYLAKYVTKTAQNSSSSGLHRYEVAEGFQPRKVSFTGRTGDQALAAASAAMAGEPERVWWSADDEAWVGPPAVWASWAA